MTSTIEQPPTESPERDVRLDNQNRNLKIILVVVTIIALALGGVLIYNAATDDSGGTMPAEVQQVVDDFFNASSEADYEAFLEATTDGFTRPEYWIRDDDTSAPLRDVATLADMEETFSQSGALYEITNVGAPLVQGDGPWFVSQAQIWEVRANEYTPGGDYYEAIYTLAIVDDDGTLRVDDAYWTGIGPIDAEN